MNRLVLGQPNIFRKTTAMAHTGSRASVPNPNVHHSPHVHLENDGAVGKEKHFLKMFSPPRHFPAIRPSNCSSVQAATFRS